MFSLQHIYWAGGKWRVLKGKGFHKKFSRASIRWVWILTYLWTKSFFSFPFRVFSTYFCGTLTSCEVHVFITIPNFSNHIKKVGYQCHGDKWSSRVGLTSRLYGITPNICISLTFILLFVGQIFLYINLFFIPTLP